MERWKSITLGVVIIAAGAAGVNAAVDARRPKGSDTEQIQRMLFEGEQAAEKGDAGTIHRFISPNYKDEVGMKDTQLKFQISRYLRERRNLEISIPSQSIHVEMGADGKTAQVSFTLSASSGTTEGSATAADLPMRLNLAKEPVQYYLVFPGEEWKVVGAEGYPAMDF